jgi:DNA-binding SARP family transcriptional activator
VELNPEVPLWVDTAVFKAHYAAATELWRAGRVDEAITTYEQAEHLYRDDYLLDDLYREWTVIPREQFKDQYLISVARLADAALRHRDYSQCIDYCHKILASDVSREDAYQRLMRCHAEMGDRTRALRRFDLCQEFLQRE